MKPHPLLFPFSFVYGCVVSLRNLFFDFGMLQSVDVGVPVISVGNITAGGSGKTPIVIEIGKIYQEYGKKVAVISRGYGRVGSGLVVVSDGTEILSDARQGGDEPVYIAEQLKNAVVIVDEQRVRAAKKAVKEFESNVIILDDGFQHRYVRRDLDIVLLNGSDSPFRTSLIPSGYRREPLRSLRRANAIIVTRVESDVNTVVRSIFERKEIVTPNKFSCSLKSAGIKHIHGNVKQSLKLIKNSSAIAVSGIANPDSFIREIKLHGVNIKETFSFNDHHRYTKTDILNILHTFIKQETDCILTTEKDSVKLKEFEDELSSIPIFALTMDVSIHQYAQWKNFILSVFKS